MSGTIVLGYWAIRGLQQPIRFLLEYTKLPYEEKLYNLKQDAAGKYVDRSEWFDVKSSIGLDFPNLPYMKDGDVSLTQSSPILRYIARKVKPELLGNTNAEQATIDMLIEELSDYRNALVTVVYRSRSEEDFKAKLAIWKDTTMKNYITNLSKFLGAKKFLSGSEIRLCDFIFYEILDYTREIAGEEMKKLNCSNLYEYIDRFENIPEIKSYIASDKYIKRPFNNPCAFFY